jgi:hypothetical protein
MEKMNFLNFEETTKRQRKNRYYTKQTALLSEFVREISPGKKLFSASYKSAVELRFGTLPRHRSGMDHLTGIGLRSRRYCDRKCSRFLRTG